MNDILYSNKLGSFSFCLTKHIYIREIKINKELKACQDWDVWIKILKNTGLNGYVLSDPLVNYYSGHESLSNNYSQYWSSYELFYNSIWENLKFAHKFYYYYNKRVVKLKILMESCFDKT